MTRTASLAVFCCLLSIFVNAAAFAGERPMPFARWTRPVAPELTLEDLNQKLHVLQPLQGQIAVVHFFATWCDSCREELPALRRLAAREPASTIRLIMVSVAEPDARVRSFAAKQGLDMPILMDRDRTAARHWGVSVLPTTFILDDSTRAGLVIEQDFDWDRIGPADLAAALSAAASTTLHSQPPQGDPR